MKSPTMLYKSSEGATVTTIVDRCDVDAMHAKGWRESPAEALEIAPQSDSLKAQAERLGIKVDGRWSAARLESAIAKAKE